jgi:uncharacterized protein YlxP (DUF503 family)
MMSVAGVPNTVLATELKNLKAELDALAALVNDLKAKYNAAVALMNDLKTKLSAHTHSGVTSGSSDTETAPAITADDAAVTAVPDVTIQTQ